MSCAGWVEITSLCKNIPKIDTFNIIKDYVIYDDQFTRKTTVPQGKFLDLVLTTTRYTFNSQFYLKTEYVAMRGPASSNKGEFYMQSHEQTAVFTALHPPKDSFEQFLYDT